MTNNFQLKIQKCRIKSFMIGSACFRDQNDQYVSINPSDIKLEGSTYGCILDLNTVIKFVNPSSEPQNISYVFTISPNVAIYETSFTVLGQTTKMQVKEKEEAEQTFSEGKINGRASAMSVISMGIQNISIGNVPEHSEFTINLKSVIQGAFFHNNLEFPLPSSILDVSKGEVLIEKITQCTFESSISINFGTALISSVSISGLDGEFNSTDKIYRSSGFPHSKTLTLKISLENNPVSLSVIGGHYASICPYFESTSEGKSDFIFIVDCSGSMSGSRINSASECLQCFVSSLPINCNFDIIRFGSNFHSLFGKLTPNNAKNFQIAKDYATNLKADLGGTDLYPVLEEIISKPIFHSESDHSLQLFIITDGEVLKKDKCIQIAGSHRDLFRIFSLGISSEVDRDLVQRIARSTGGDYSFVKNDKIADVVIPVLSASMKPAVHQIHVEAVTEHDGQTTEHTLQQVPFPPPIVFAETADNIFVKSTEDLTGAEIMASGNMNGEQFEIPIQCKIEAPEAALRAMYAVTGFSDFRHQIDSGVAKLEDIKPMIVQLSVESGILSDYTALVGVSDVRVERPHNDHLLRESACINYSPPMTESRAKSSNCAGGGGARERVRERCCDEDICYERAPLNDECKYLDCCEADELMCCANEECDYIVEEEPVPTMAEVPKPKLNLSQIIGLQKFEGFWENKTQLEALLGNEIIINLPEGVGEVEKVMGTVLALAMLRKFEKNRKNAWSMVESKAISWLKSVMDIEWNDVIDQVTQSL